MSFVGTRFLLFWCQRKAILRFLIWLSQLGLSCKRPLIDIKCRWASLVKLCTVILNCLVSNLHGSLSCMLTHYTNVIARCQVRLGSTTTRVNARIDGTSWTVSLMHPSLGWPRRWGSKPMRGNICGKHWIVPGLALWVLLITSCP